MKINNFLSAAAVTFILFIGAVPVMAVMPQYFLDPDPGYLSNDVIDIIGHDGAIWMATSEGLNYTDDLGENWYIYDEYNGLVSSGVSAFFSIPTLAGQRIWVATNHEETVDGIVFNISDGVSYSDDNGDTWTQIDFETPPNDIDFVWGGDRQIFDIAGHYDASNSGFDNWMFFSAFAGGFLGSNDGGMSWRRIFPSRSDSLQFFTPNEQPSLRNRNFSCVVDTSHSDSIFVWSGTAGGIFQHIYSEPKDKPFSKYINDIAFCTNCRNEDTNFVYFAGKTSLTRTTKTGGGAISRFTTDGLPGDGISAVIDFNGTIWVGTYNEDIDQSTGLAYSDDFGETFTPINSFTEVIGPGRMIKDFEILNGSMYIAAEEAGLFVSYDSGLSWQHIFVDSSAMDPSNRRNVVHALNGWGDTLRVGTDSGLVNLYMDPAGNFDPNASLFHVFIEDSFSSTRVIKIATQRFGDSVDVIWTINRPNDLIFAAPAVGRSLNGGQNFNMLQSGALVYDIAFIGDATYLAGAEGVRISVEGENPDAVKHNIYEIVQTFVVDSMSLDTITVFNTLGDTIFVGSDNGYAVSVNGGTSYNIVRVNTDPLTPDAVLNHTSALVGLDGDWIPAIAVQYDDDRPFGNIWASTRPTFGGLNALSVGVPLGIVDSAGQVIRYERLWLNVYDNFAWNFAFNGDTVFAATNDGLIVAELDSLMFGDVTYEWTMLDLEDSDGFPLVLPGTAVYGVEVVDNYLWVGTDDRTIKLDLANFNDQTPYYVIDLDTPTEEVYAFPVPYSHVQNQVVEFHFTLEEDARVTLEIYDFAMNLVKRVIDDEPFSAGIYPQAGFGRRTWDGRNGKGDEVAVGVYYFKVELSNGEIRWGKLAMIP